MDLSSHRQQDEDRIMQRQLYRAGQTQSAPGGTAPQNAGTKGGFSSSPAPRRSNNDKQSNGQRILLMILMLGVGYYLLYGNPGQRRKAYISLGVAAWLLFLGTMSYCLCLPNIEEIRQERRAIFMDPNLSFEQKREKIRELDSKLTQAERRQMVEMDRKEWTRKGNARMNDFLKLTPEQRAAQLIKEAEERRQFFEKMRQAWGNRGNRGNGGAGGGNRNGGPGGGNRNGAPGGGNRGGPGGGGNWGGGGGGGGANAAISRIENGQSPESRAGRVYQRALMAQLGIGFGRGGPGGPGGGGGGGGGGRR